MLDNSPDISVPDLQQTVTKLLVDLNPVSEIGYEGVRYLHGIGEATDLELVTALMDKIEYLWEEGNETGKTLQLWRELGKLLKKGDEDGLASQRHWWEGIVIRVPHVATSTSFISIEIVKAQIRVCGRILSSDSTFAASARSWLEENGERVSEEETSNSEDSEPEGLGWY